MPRYFTHFYNSEVLCDERGQDFASLDDARAGARRSASELIAEHILEGIPIDLSDRLEIMDEAGNLMVVVRFSQFFKNSIEISDAHDAW